MRKSHPLFQRRFDAVQPSAITRCHTFSLPALAVSFWSGQHGEGCHPWSRSLAESKKKTVRTGITGRNSRPISTRPPFGATLFESSTRFDEFKIPNIKGLLHWDIGFVQLTSEGPSHRRLRLLTTVSGGRPCSRLEISISTESNTIALS